MADQVTENDRRVRYVATAGQTVFDIDFPVYMQRDADGNDYIPVAVYKNGILVDDADYTVTIDTLVVTLDSGAAAGDIVTIEGNTLVKRESGYPLGGGLSSSLLNRDMNRVIEVLQEVTRDTARSIILNKAESSNVPNTLPLRDAGKMLLWGDNPDDGLINGPDASDIAAAQSNAVIAVDAKIAAQAASTAASGSASNAAASATDAANSATLAAALASSAGGLKRARLLATTNITLSGIQTIDFTAGASGNRVLVIGQSNPAENGVYVMASGTWSRASDANTLSKLVSLVVVIEEGLLSKDFIYQCTTDEGGTLGVTAITWATPKVTYPSYSITVDKLWGGGAPAGKCLVVDGSGVMSLTGNQGLEVPISSGTVVAGATVVSPFTLTGLPTTGYKEFKLKLRNFTQSVSNFIVIQLYDGSTYDVGATDYSYAYVSASSANGGSSGNSRISVLRDNSGLGWELDITIELKNFISSTKRSILKIQAEGYNTATAGYYSIGGAGHNTAKRHTGLRLFIEGAGNATFDWEFLGVV